MSTRSTAGQSAERRACVRTMSHLAKDTADTPHINTITVIGRAKQDLGRAVPARRHVIGEDDRVRLVGGGGWILVVVAHRAGEAKVGNLHQAVAIQEEVGGLHVAV